MSTDGGRFGESGRRDESINKLSIKRPASETDYNGMKLVSGVKRPQFMQSTSSSKDDR